MASVAGIRRKRSANLAEGKRGHGEGFSLGYVIGIAFTFAFATKGKVGIICMDRVRQRRPDRWRLGQSPYLACSSRKRRCGRPFPHPLSLGFILPPGNSNTTKESTEKGAKTKRGENHITAHPEAHALCDDKRISVGPTSLLAGIIISPPSPSLLLLLQEPPNNILPQLRLPRDGSSGKTHHPHSTYATPLDSPTLIFPPREKLKSTPRHFHPTKLAPFEASQHRPAEETFRVIDCLPEKHRQKCEY